MSNLAQPFATCQAPSPCSGCGFYRQEREFCVYLPYNDMSLPTARAKWGAWQGEKPCPMESGDLTRPPTKHATHPPATQAPEADDPDVPAEVTSSTIEITSILYLRNGAPPQRGHLTPQLPKPLRQLELVFRRWEELYPVLLALTGSPKRAEMLRKCLVIQALCTDAFPSAHYLAGVGLANEKTWDRCLAWLRERKLVRTWRLNRQGGQQSVNLIDLGPLWERVRKLLTGLVGPVSRVGRSLWVKVSGVWVSAQSLLDTSRRGGGLGGSSTGPPECQPTACGL